MVLHAPVYGVDRTAIRIGEVQVESKTALQNGQDVLVLCEAVIQPQAVHVDQVVAGGGSSAFGPRAVGLLFSRLVEPGVLSIPDLIRKLTVAPARILGVGGGALTEGDRADVTVIDPDAAWVYDANASRSLSRNTPFHGWTLKGRAVVTILDGRITHRV